MSRIRIDRAPEPSSSSMIEGWPVCRLRNALPVACQPIRLFTRSKSRMPLSRCRPWCLTCCQQLDRERYAVSRLLMQAVFNCFC